MKSMFPHILRRGGLRLGAAVLLSLPVLAADAPAPKPAKKIITVEPTDKPVSGTFVSFEDGVLALEIPGVLLQVNLPANADTAIWNHDADRLQPVDTAEAMTRLKELLTLPDVGKKETAESMSWRKAGIQVAVKKAGETMTVRIGEKKDPFVGNFFSFKDDYVCFRLNKPHRQFGGKYGDILRLKMNEHIPVYESVDGGEYQPVGSPRTALANAKEGTVISVYHNYITETDEFYLVLLGVKQK